jgi:hypothetical protein
MRLFYPKNSWLSNMVLTYAEKNIVGLSVNYRTEQPCQKLDRIAPCRRRFTEIYPAGGRCMVVGCSAIVMGVGLAQSLVGRWLPHWPKSAPFLLHPDATILSQPL